jgi:hypothetical protein
MNPITGLPEVTGARTRDGSTPGGLANLNRSVVVSSTRPVCLLTVNFRQPSYEFTFNVGIDLLF